MRKLPANLFLVESSIFIRKWSHHINRNSGNHSHEFIELVYVISGSCKHWFEGHLTYLKAGDVFIVNQGEVHRYDFQPDEKLDIYIIGFLPSFLPGAILAELELLDAIDFYYLDPLQDVSERLTNMLNIKGEQVEIIEQQFERMLKMKNELKMVHADQFLRLELLELFILLSHFMKLKSIQKGAEQQTSSEQFIQRVVDI